jgi:hypothetical protein
VADQVAVEINIFFNRLFNSPTGFTVFISGLYIGISLEILLSGRKICLITIFGDVGCCAVLEFVCSVDILDPEIVFETIF